MRTGSDANGPIGSETGRFHGAGSNLFGPADARCLYLDGIDNTLNVIQQHRWDESLEEFYERSYLQLNIPNETLKSISEATAGRLVSQQHTTPSAILFFNWQHEPQLEAKLRRYSGSDSRFNRFTVAAGKIIELLAKLAENPRNRLDAADQISVVASTSKRSPVMPAHGPHVEFAGDVPTSEKTGLG